jgi:acyl carrier protein
MDDLTQRLIGCFQTVFPGKTEAEIPGMSQATSAEWDSIAAITLVNVIDDEFQIELDMDDVADLDSFDKVAKHLETRLQTL